MPKYSNMNPEEVKVAHFNPARRINRERLSSLLLSIQKYGILEPLALAHDYTLADGHRRLECAKLLTLPIVPVAVYGELKVDASTLWVVLNSETMNLTPAQWLAAVGSGLPITTPGFPESLRRRIVELETMLGSEGIATLVEQGRSPLIIDAARRVGVYCNRRQDEAFIKQIVVWMMGVGNAFSVRAAMDEGVPADILAEAIEEGYELTRVWDIARE